MGPPPRARRRLCRLAAHVRPGMARDSTDVSCGSVAAASPAASAAAAAGRVRLSRADHEQFRAQGFLVVPRLVERP
jgi:hypothetical protein